MGRLLQHLRRGNQATRLRTDDGHGPRPVARRPAVADLGPDGPVGPRRRRRPDLHAAEMLRASTAPPSSTPVATRRGRRCATASMASRSWPCPPRSSRATAGSTTEAWLYNVLQHTIDPEAIVEDDASQGPEAPRVRVDRSGVDARASARPRDRPTPRVVRRRGPDVTGWTSSTSNSMSRSRAVMRVEQRAWGGVFEGAP